MGGPSQRRPQNIGSSERRRTGRAQRSIEVDSGSDNGSKWLRTSLKIKKIL